MNLEKEIFELSLEDIMPNRFQPREIFEDEALKELAESIKKHGIIQPIIVRKIGDKYEIIAGERRYRASKLAGKKTIPALIRNLDDKEAAKVALLENLQRKDLSPIEEAKTYQTILKLDNLTQEELAQNLGKSQAAVANKIRLLNLDEEVQTALLNNEISERHARSLLVLPNHDQKELLSKIINERLTVKQLDDEIEKIINQDNNPSREPSLVSNETLEENKKDISESIIDSNTNDSDNITTPKNNIFEKLRVDNNTNNDNKQSISIEDLDNEFSEIDKMLSKKEDNTNIDKLIEKTIEEGSKEETNDKKEEAEVQPTVKKDTTEKYDLRFAINNFRQAIQNTEKFGFKVKTEEFENNENYQLIVTIQKKDIES